MSVKKTNGKIAQKDNNIVIQKIDIRPIVRTNQDIQSWRHAILAAENVFSPRRILLYRLYFDLILDGHLSSVIDKRIRAVTTCPLIFTDNGKEVPEITSLVRSEMFVQILEEILQSKFWGNSLIEFSDFSPEGFNGELIPRMHVQPEKGLILVRETDMTGFEYRLPPFNSWMLEAGRKNDLGLLMKAAQYVIYKRGGFGDWAQYTEIFGMPFRKATYDGQDEKTRQQLIQALEAAGSAAYMVIPSGSDIEILPSSGSSNNSELYKRLIDACNDEMSKLILGNTLTTEQGDKGARSLGDVHQEVEDQVHQSDKMFVLFKLNNQFKKLLEIHGYPIGNGEFSFTNDETIDITKRILVDVQLAGLVPIDDEYFYETYKIPKPANYKELKKQQLLAKKTVPPAPVANPKNTPQDPTQTDKNTNSFIAYLKSFFDGAPQK